MKSYTSKNKLNKKSQKIKMKFRKAKKHLMS